MAGRRGPAALARVPGRGTMKPSRPDPAGRPPADRGALAGHGKGGAPSSALVVCLQGDGLAGRDPCAREHLAGLGGIVGHERHMDLVALHADRQERLDVDARVGEPASGLG